MISAICCGIILFIEVIYLYYNGIKNINVRL